MTDARRLHLVVTGAGGYIGRRVVEMALAGGHRVTALSRGDLELPVGAGRASWRMGEPLPDAVRHDEDIPRVLVHLAHDWRDRGESDNLNLAGSRALRDDARRASVARLVFVSSVSARADALNLYGRTKWRAEALFDGPDAVSLRVGLVYGGPRVAMYGLLCRLVGTMPVLPMVESGKLVQPIHRDEVARGILRAAEGRLSGALNLAGATPMSFGDLLRALSQGLHGRRLRVLPIPLRLALAGCSVASRLPGLRVDRERVLGLAGTRVVDSAADLAALGLAPRPFAARLADEPAGRKALLREARTLLRYVLRAEPGGALLRRYARAAGLAGPASPLPLPGLIHRAPWLLRFSEPLRPGDGLGARLAAATRLAEASREGERALSGPRGRRLACLLADAALESLALPVRLVHAIRQR